jgi:hypothetical protein
LQIVSPAPPPEQNGVRSGIITAIALLLTIAGTYLWVSMVAPAWQLAGGLLDAGRHFQRAQKKLTAGALKDARYETLAGVAAAARARAGFETAGPLFDLAASINRIDHVLGETDHLVRAAELSGRAAEGTLDVAQNALRGPKKIIAKDPEDPKGGAHVRLERVRAIANTVGNIRDAVTEIAKELNAVQLKRLPRRLRPRVKDGLTQAEETSELLVKAHEGLRLLPVFMGDDEPRVYLLGMQNSAEQRGTGGAMLQFALLQIAEGKPELSRALSVYEVDKDRQQVSIPLPEDAWYVAGLPDAQRFGNANWSPDWPLSAGLTVDYGRASQPAFPDEVHGVFAVTPITMQNLLPGVGPYRLPTGNRISAKKVVHFLLNKAYASYPIPKVRRARLSEVVDIFYERLLRPDHPAELVKGMGKSLAEKHIQMWMANPAEQAFIEEMDWDGAIDPASDADYLYVVEQNVGGNKLDYFADQTVDTKITLSEDDAEISTAVEVANNVFLPQPRWSMGDTGRPSVCRSKGACPLHRTMINLYVHPEAELQSATVEAGTRLDVAADGLAAWPSGDRPAEHFELGKKVWSTVLEIAPQDTGRVRLDYLMPNVVRTEDGRRVYRLKVQQQPKLRPQTLRLSLALPAGARAIKAPGWRQQGERLLWDKPLRSDLILEVSWRS